MHLSKNMWLAQLVHNLLNRQMVALSRKMLKKQIELFWTDLIWLVVSTHLKNISQNGIISSNRGEKNNNLKPAPSYGKYILGAHKCQMSKRTTGRNSKSLKPRNNSLVSWVRGPEVRLFFSVSGHSTWILSEPFAIEWSCEYIDVYQYIDSHVYIYIYKYVS